MKKIVFLSLFALCLPWVLSAQSVNDDLYYVPSKKKEETKRTRKESVVKDEIVVRSNAPTKVYSSPGRTTVVVRDRKGKTRNIDEYNRRYDSGDYDFSQENGTLYANEKEHGGLNGEWMNGEFEGSQDDYEYATRIIRFRNPRYAISISSPLYWDVAYGLNSWDWNVYTDGMYAYAFPTFSNRLWWDWRYNSYGWGGYPYYGWGWNSRYGPGWDIGWYGGWGGWYGYRPYYSGAWYPGGDYWGGGYRDHNTYTNRRSISRYNDGRPTSIRRSNGSTGIRMNGSSAVRSSGTSPYQRSERNGATSIRRVISGEEGTSMRSSSLRSRNSYVGGSSFGARRSAYTRPSSTRFNSSSEGGIRRSNSSFYSGARRYEGTSTYNRGSSNAPTRIYSRENNRSSNYYSSPTRSSSGNFSSGGSRGSRSYSSGGGGATRSSGGGGGSSRRR